MEILILNELKEWLAGQIETAKSANGRIFGDAGYSWGGKLIALEEVQKKIRQLENPDVGRGVGHDSTYG